MTIDYVKQGKKNRRIGAAFERKVRKDLEEKGWIVDKWSNNIDLEKNILIPAKRKYNPFSRAYAIGTGFPDFIAFRDSTTNYDKIVIGVESKINGYLDKIEKEKCKWLLDNNVLSKILIAYRTKEKNKIKVNYKEFE